MRVDPAPAGGGPVDAWSVPPTRAWWAVAVLALFQIFSMVDRTIIAVLIPEIRADLGLNDFQISLVQGLAFAIFYGIVGLFIGGLVDRSSRRLIMFGGIVIWSAAAAGTGLARHYVHLFLGRLFVGFGEGAISPAAQSLLSDLFPRHRLSTPMAIFTSAGVAGLSLSFIVGGLLLEYFAHTPLPWPFAGLAPWRQVLIATGLPGVLIAFLAFTLPETRRGAPSQAQSSWGAFFRFLGDNPRMMGGILIGFGLTAMANQGMMTWAPTYARRVLGLGAAEVCGAMGLAVGIGGIFGGIALGMLVDHYFGRGRRGIALSIFASLALVVPPLAALAFIFDDPTLMFAAVLVMLLTVGGCFGPGLAAIQMISPPHMRGRFGALAVLISNLGGFAFGPMMIGAITDYGFADPDRVGDSIALSLVLLGPAAGAALLWARPAFVARMNAAAS